MNNKSLIFLLSVAMEDGIASGKSLVTVQMKNPNLVPFSLTRGFNLITSTNERRQDGLFR